MKIRVYLKKSFAIAAAFSASLSIFVACATNDTSQETIPLKAGQVVELQTTRRGLTTSLDYASGFNQLNLDEKERSFHPAINYFETLLSYGNNNDPRNTFLLVNEYLVSNQQKYGIRFFDTLLRRYDQQLTDKTRAHYLAANAILRATHADNIQLLSRIGWVNNTFDLLEQANRLTNNADPLVHWSAGLVYAQVPFFFFKKDDAYRELNWIAEHPSTEPISGFYREAYHYLARLHASDGHAEIANEFLKKSGYEDYQPNTLFMGWFTSTSDAGATMSAQPTLKEVVKNRVYSLYGFGFSDVHFVVSKNGNALIAIDAGTHPHSLQAAHELLKRHHPDLPPITTAIITHAHWDHIGGYTYLKSLNPDLKIIGRDNYHNTLKRIQRTHSYKQFRSTSFTEEWVKNYTPDMQISEPRTINIEGSTIELIPVTGGETEDALLVSFPDTGVIFVGDVLMPYYGEPWVEEGFIDGAINTMDQIIQRNPQYILHGHYPLTFIYGPEQLRRFRDDYKWLVDATRNHLNRGYSVKEIIRLNLIPPGLNKHPEDYFSFLAPRDHIIARVADHMLGIWQENKNGQEPEGLDNLTATEYGRFLEKYLGLSTGVVADALQKMISNGDNELALKMAVAAETRYGADASIQQLKTEAANRLRSSAQFFDPFKFVVYTEMVNLEHKPMPSQ